MAIVSGRNVADAYFMRDPTQNFADVDASVVGAVVPELSDAFDDYWNSKFAIPIVYFARDGASDEAASGASTRGWPTSLRLRNSWRQTSMCSAEDRSPRTSTTRSSDRSGALRKHESI
jgi:phosphatidylserine/phosphatidylglycerophosphate/cardiolipin synthase-like enzyme